jgi:S-adenosylmethionine:tRNA ribosyltransferase-isomerase
MKTSDFNFDLPAELLAEHPSEHRDEARLMVLTEKLKPFSISCSKMLLIILTKEIFYLQQY